MSALATPAAGTHRPVRTTRPSLVRHFMKS